MIVTHTKHHNFGSSTIDLTNNTMTRFVFCDAPPHDGPVVCQCMDGNPAHEQRIMQFVNRMEMHQWDEGVMEIKDAIAQINEGIDANERTPHCFMWVLMVRAFKERWSC